MKMTQHNKETKILHERMTFLGNQYLRAIKQHQKQRREFQRVGESYMRLWNLNEGILK